MTWEELREIIASKYEADRLISKLMDKAEKGDITYREANQYAIKAGEILADAMRENGALPDGITGEEASELLTAALGNNYQKASQMAQAAQENVNRAAGIGLKSAVPKVRQDRIDGMATEIVNRGYSSIQKSFDDQVVNFTQSAVDDTVAVNAYFQAESGLSPKIRRQAEPKACKWCRVRAGTFHYEEVRKTGSEVYRRHQNCRCTVEFIAGEKRQNVWNKKIQYQSEPRTPKTEKSMQDTDKVKDVTSEWLKRDTSYGSVELYEEIDRKKQAQEIETAYWLRDMFGGDVKLLPEENIGKPNPDYVWNGKIWELKRVSTPRSIDNQIHKAIKQLRSDDYKEGGVVIDISRITISSEKALEIIAEKGWSRSKQDTTIIVKEKEQLVKVLEIKKRGSAP
ncbi:hypothetical protein J2S20_002312 [Moryella indoligenes]|uniref:tRNA nuclease CdiA C-terminal domain-containing protein n=1 Tax=Moryella indoligenes TaxID=371674 RepID=A0AAE3VC65_9FIRM|nr:hypothetical protein [Moryella indoligenes]MDQ0153591.1 hypothetical protein [Moryella indoligenes]